jgi:hypothetical protein
MGGLVKIDLFGGAKNSTIFLSKRFFKVAKSFPL